MHGNITFTYGIFLIVNFKQTPKVFLYNIIEHRNWIYIFDQEMNTSSASLQCWLLLESCLLVLARFKDMQTLSSQSHGPKICWGLSDEQVRPIECKQNVQLALAKSWEI